jgi:hypothetical protein
MDPMQRGVGTVFGLGEYVLEAALIERVGCLLQSGGTGELSLLYWVRCKCIDEAVSFASTKSINFSILWVHAYTEDSSEQQPYTEF